jgi:hypothetical protein
MANKITYKIDLNASQSANRAQCSPRYAPKQQNTTTGLQIDFSRMLAVSRAAKKHRFFILRG